MSREFTIKVPASSANIGPGFDVLGVGLALYLELKVSVNPSFPSTIKDPNHCYLSYDSEGSVPLGSDENLITRTALYVLRACARDATAKFPENTHVHVVNPIPLGRGLGSSGAAVVAGVMLANEVAGLGFDKQRMLDFCLMIERHPDNITAAMMGGFCGSYLRDMSAEDVLLRDVPLSEVLPEKKPEPTSSVAPQEPPQDIGRHVKYHWNPAVKCIAIIPQFEVSTASSRAVLPDSYLRADVIFNLQRLSVLTTALSANPPDAKLVYAAMQDKIHQPYRAGLIPGLTEILSSVTPETHTGLLGICLSGAGPTILALATEGFDAISSEITGRFKRENDIDCVVKVLELAHEGAVVEYV
ncbi:hypothetical protein BABINDRAFT_163849 [Babjeviella inositovora NRRL Y-12698]|uniref:Homoserine kinase n=1 Tax=Babjeviella inositovora NRRL Y-12698 TaxID=984486 RepID=A0A1E3QHF3_9ASCO|nr:uncharacterized protein BABINDRAFT_163849 [Babjeviella inositovora NRRL Y-12698]ODQ77121.1 hypothetical protein BABINDRAFT_163849 [Babjeviella inositovora NRRL Y-12698]